MIGLSLSGLGTCEPILGWKNIFLGILKIKKFDNLAKLPKNSFLNYIKSNNGLDWVKNITWVPKICLQFTKAKMYMYVFMIKSKQCAHKI